MECEVCGKKAEILWRISLWSDCGRTKVICPLCGLRLLGMDESVSSIEEKRFRITEEIREKKVASA